MHKRCTGPAHEEPVWLPATEKYFYMQKTGKYKGKLTYKCRLCANWKKLKSPGSIQGLVPLQKVKPYFIEGVNRVGISEFARRTGLSVNGINNILNSESQRRVQKLVARKAMLEVISMRRKGEVRHRASIAHGAHLRGRQEREIQTQRDYYRSHGDGETETRRRLRGAA